MGIGVGAVVVGTAINLHITVGHTECVPIRENTAGPQQMDTNSTWCGVTRCWAVKETAPNRSGLYLLVKLM